MHTSVNSISTDAKFRHRKRQHNPRPLTHSALLSIAVATFLSSATLGLADDQPPDPINKTKSQIFAQNTSRIGSFFIQSGIRVNPFDPYTNPEIPTIITYQIDWDPQNLLLITYEENFAPAAFFFNGRHYDIHDDMLLDEPADVRFLPADHFFKKSVNFDTHPEYTGESDVSLLVEKIVPNQEIETLKNRRTVIFQNENRTLFISTRNAVEQIQYGEKLKVFAGLKPGEAGQIIAGFDRQHTSIDTAFRTKRIANVRSLAESGAPPTPRGSKVELQDKLLELLFVNHSRQYLPQNTNTLINFLLASSVKGEDPQSIISLRLGKIADAINEEIDEKFSSNELIFLDPYLRGPYIDQVAWIDEEPAFLDKAFILLGNLTDKEARFSAAHHIGSMGFSFNFRAFKFFNSTLLGTGPPEVNAAFGAHWGLPVKDDDVLAVVNVLKTSLDFPTRWNAIEVLILLDEVEQVPQKALQEWDRVFLYSGEASTRLRKLAYLAQTKSGRAHMADLLLQDETPPDVAKIITSVLTGHIDATEELSRFDAISQEEIVNLRKTIKSRNPKL